MLEDHSLRRTHPQALSDANLLKRLMEFDRGSWTATRWTAAAAAQEASLATLPAAALLDAAALTYHGPLRGMARAALLRRWREAFRGAGLPLPAEWSVRASLVDASELRAWNQQVCNMCCDGLHCCP